MFRFFSVPSVCSYSILGANLFVKPCPGEGPVAFGGRLRNPQHLGSFGQRKTNKIAELDHFCALWVELGEFFQGFTHSEDVVGLRISGRRVLFQLDALLASAMANPQLLSCVVSKNPSHGLGSSGEEMVAILPLAILLAA